jgi:hypothetical protein
VPAGHGAATYNPQYQNQQQPQYGYGNQQQQQPQYGAGNQQQGNAEYGQTGGYYNQNQASDGANQGYYGGGQQPAHGATELQSPPYTYQGGQNAYTPPAGPPPGKG